MYNKLTTDRTHDKT